MRRTGTVTTDGNTYTVATDKTGGSAPAQVAAPVAVTHQQSSMPASSVSITALDLKGETVTITNTGSASVSLAGWKLTDEGAKHSYTFIGTTVAGCRLGDDRLRHCDRRYPWVRSSVR